MRYTIKCFFVVNPCTTEFIHIHSGVFSGFCIILFNKLVNVTWDGQRGFNQNFKTLSIPGDFHFGDLINAGFSSSTAMFFHSCSFTFLFSFSIFPIQLARHITRFFLYLHFFLELFYAVLRQCFFYRNLIFPYFSIEFFCICLEDLIFSVEFVTFIKSFFVCSYLYFLLQFLFDIWNINCTFDLILSYNFPGFPCFLDLYSFRFC